MSDYGKGFAYNLGLFLAHAEREIIDRPGFNGAAAWFSGAADHLYELETSPEVLGELLARDALSFRKFCFVCRGGATKEDVQTAIRWAKRLLCEWDKAKGVPVELAEYS